MQPLRHEGALLNHSKLPFAFVQPVVINRNAEMRAEGLQLPEGGRGNIAVIAEEHFKRPEACLAIPDMEPVRHLEAFFHEFLRGVTRSLQKIKACGKLWAIQHLFVMGRQFKEPPGESGRGHNGKLSALIHQAHRAGVAPGVAPDPVDKAFIHVFDRHRLREERRHLVKLREVRVLFLH